MDENAPLLQEAVEIFDEFRQRPLRKKPATAELIGFVQSLREAGFGVGDNVRTSPSWEGLARVTLLKTSEDQGRAIAQLDGSSV
jgi:hypothetical protein